MDRRIGEYLPLHIQFGEYNVHFRSVSSCRPWSAPRSVRALPWCERAAPSKVADVQICSRRDFRNKLGLRGNGIQEAVLTGTLAPLSVSDFNQVLLIRIDVTVVRPPTLPGWLKPESALASWETCSHSMRSLVSFCPVLALQSGGSSVSLLLDGAPNFGMGP